MSTVSDMLGTHPNDLFAPQAALAACIEACFECAAVCSSCADACLAEDMVAELRYCIRTDLDCADICTTTGRVLTRQTEPDLTLIRAQLEACRTACKVCGDSCSSHADMHAHCKVCAESCRRCEGACDSLLRALN